MGCCRKLFTAASTGTRAVICRRWVPPLRIITLSSLAVNLRHSFQHHWQLSPGGTFLSFLHVLISWLVLLECRRSVQYHRSLLKFADD